MMTECVSTVESERDALIARVDQLSIAAARYEKLRKLNPRQFTELWGKSITGFRFDDLVDEL